MNPELQSTLLKVALPIAVIALVLFIAKKRGISWRDDLGLAWPRPAVALLWWGFGVVWVIAEELVIAALGMGPPAPWKEYPLLIVLLRIAAIGILGPIAEEAVMRGMVFYRIQRTRLGPSGAIVITAAVWAAMHLRYDWQTLVMIFLDGLVLGTARHRSRSLYVPIVMHVAGNLYSIYQSLAG